MPFNVLTSPLQAIATHPGSNTGIRLFVKRDDLLHPDIQGNKWRKLAPVLPVVKQSFPGGIVTFGGPFSNHLQAVAAAGRVFDIPTRGIVRGLHADPDNPTLLEARNNGMVLLPVSKNEYDFLKNNPEALSREFPDCFILPEGGSTGMAVHSCAAITREILTQLRAIGPAPSPDTPLYICVPAGTGCTAAGVVDGLEVGNARVLVFPVVNRGFDVQTILQLLNKTQWRNPVDLAELQARFELVREYEYGGFAKFHPPLIDFAWVFKEQTGVLLDPVYTTKMTLGVYDMLRKGYFPRGSTVVTLHTGGLQGWDGFKARYGVG